MLLALFALGGLNSSRPDEPPSAARRDAAPRLALPSPGPVPSSLLSRLPAGPRAVQLATLALEAGGPGRSPGTALVEFLDLEGLSDLPPGIEGPLRVEYTLEAELTRQVFRVLWRARAELGHVILLDPNSGRVLAYASTDMLRFPPTRVYPAASLLKVITTAAALDRLPDFSNRICRYTGNPYRLAPSQIDPPSGGRTVSLGGALALSNNQCFAQLAVHTVGEQGMREAISRFGLLSEPAPGHAAGIVHATADRYALGMLGCGISGCYITPLHAALLAGVLANGELVAPRWIARVSDAAGRELALPAPPPARRVLAPAHVAELRSMLVGTTVRGTASGAFQAGWGQPLLGPVKVAGKTGSVSGRNPEGSYEWFIGAAPAENPSVAIAVLLVHGKTAYRTASEVAAEVLRYVFCADGPCRADAPLRASQRGTGARSAG